MANVAVALARLGGAARFIGKLSQDGFGRMLLHVLQENQVDTRYVTTTTEGNTTLALVTLQGDGQRTFTFYRQSTADTLLQVGDLHEQAWRDVVLCHAGSVLLATDPARSAQLTIMEQARQRGLLLSFDVNARPALWDSENDIHTALAQVITQVDLLKFSAEEAHYLAPTLTEPFDPTDYQQLYALAHTLLDQGPALVIITRGPLGALVFNKQHSGTAAASALTALDTTGAGDAFMGAILHRILEQHWTDAIHLATLSAHDLQELVTFANTVSGISCTRYGGIASLPYLREIEPG